MAAAIAAARSALATLTWNEGRNTRRVKCVTVGFYNGTIQWSCKTYFVSAVSLSKSSRHYILRSIFYHLEGAVVALSYVHVSVKLRMQHR